MRSSVTRQQTKPWHGGRLSRLARPMALIATFAAGAAALAAPAIRGQVLASEAMNASLAVPELYVALQSLPNSCGPAAVATLATYLNPAAEPVSEEAVLARAELAPNGVSLGEFARLASLHGIAGAWFRVEPSNLTRLATPFVAHLTRGVQGHFVVVLHVKGQLALIADPAEGASVAPLSTLATEFGGLVFLIESGT